MFGGVFGISRSLFRHASLVQSVRFVSRLKNKENIEHKDTKAKKPQKKKNPAKTEDLLASKSAEKVSMTPSASKTTKRSSKRPKVPRQRGPVDATTEELNLDREGLHILYNGSDSNSSHIADLVFIHDYGGNAQSSWITHSQEIWPRDWLPKDLNKNIRVLSMGYKLTSSKLSTDIGRVSRHALNHLLTLRRAANNKKPIIWIGHGIGGWIIKDSIQKTKISKKKEYHQVYDHSEAVVFLGTPHVNTDNKLLDHSLACLFSQSKRLPTAINISGEYVRDLNGDFVFSVERQGIRVLNISENSPTTLGETVTAIAVPSSVSALTAEGVTNVTVDSYHNQLVLYDKKTNVYDTIAEFLKAIIKKNKLV